MIAGLSTRSRRRLQITSARWQRRAIFLLGGILVGAAAVVLAVLADQAQIAFTSISGMPGGIFSPALAVGAGLGANIASLFQGAPLPAIILLGMVSYFAGAVQARITAFVIVTEMTDNHAMVVPLMAAALIAHATSPVVCEGGFYHALSKGFIDKSVVLTKI